MNPTLLLSFYLGKQESYLWAVTQSSIELHRLPAESRDPRRCKSSFGRRSSRANRSGDEIGRRSLSTAIGFTRSGGRGEDVLAAVAGWSAVRPAVRGAGERLRERPAGLCRGTPFDAKDSRGSVPEPAGAGSTGGFLGVADPVYNSADPRGSPIRYWSLGVAERRSRSVEPAGEQRSRITAELGKLASRFRPHWAHTNPGGNGGAARRLSQRLHAAPSTIHLATHVLTSATQPEQAFLAFSLDASGNPGSAVDFRDRHAARARGADRDDRVRHGNRRRTSGRWIARTYAGMDDGRSTSHSSDKLAGAGCGRRPHSGVLSEFAGAEPAS